MKVDESRLVKSSLVTQKNAYKSTHMPEQQITGFFLLYILLWYKAKMLINVLKNLKTLLGIYEIANTLKHVLY